MASTRVPANVKVSNHPVLLHKLSIMRKKDTTQPMYRQLLRELSFYLGYEITADMNVKDVTITGSHGTTTQQELKDRVALIPVMRAGLGMVDPIMELLPTSRVHHLGMYHDSLTDCCVLYYNRLPSEVDADVAIVLEPVIGSGTTIESVIYILKQWGVKKIKVMSVVATEFGLKKLAGPNPDVEFYVGAVDQGESGSTVDPGIGDVGDRLFGTWDRRAEVQEVAGLAAFEGTVPSPSRAAAVPSLTATEPAPSPVSSAAAAGAGAPATKKSNKRGRA